MATKTKKRSEPGDPTIPLFPKLFKRTTAGGVQEWQVFVVPQNDGTAVIRIVHGLAEGKKQTTEDHINLGKNIGKANETTALEQAVAEAQSRWNKQRDRKCYGVTVEESANARALAPMLAQKYRDQRKKVDWSTAFEQPKFNGFRCLARKDDGEVTLLSREAGPFALPHIADAVNTLLKDGECLDGEIYLHGETLQQISSLIKRPRGESEKLGYYVYDTPVDAPFSERLDWLIRTCGKRGSKLGIYVAETTPVENEADLMALHSKRVSQEQMEGSILRHTNEGYKAGARAACLLKVKEFVDDEFRVTAVEEGRSTHAGMAIFVCKTSAGHEFRVTSPGSHDEKRAYWNNRRDYIDKVLTVEFQSYTKGDKPVPFHPVAIGFVR